MAEQKSRVPTSELWEQLVKAASAGQFLRQNEGRIGMPPFSAYLTSLCRERGEVPDRVIKRADIERSFGHALFRGDRKPSRDTVLQLAFGLGADVALAQSLLLHAGHSPLYPRVPRDSVISYCLLHGIGFIEAQSILAELGLPLMGGSAR